MTGVFVFTVPHEMARAEENHLQQVSGREYREYCSRVRVHLI
jgi:protein-S-isoprenylcysteine O-methyltransferase Ste14